MEDSHALSRTNRTKIIAKPWRGTMLACVYPAENFKSKAVTVKLRHGRSKRKPKLLSVKEKLADGKQPECNDTAPKLENEVSFPLFVTSLRISPSFSLRSTRVPSMYRCTMEKLSTYDNSSPSSNVLSRFISWTIRFYLEDKSQEKLGEKRRDDSR